MKTDLQRIPGVGANMEQHLLKLGYHCVAQLAGEDPEEMYLRECALAKGPVDRCVLYVYRLAVYFAQTESPEPELLKWWNWKEKREI